MRSAQPITNGRSSKGRARSQKQTSNVSTHSLPTPLDGERVLVYLPNNRQVKNQSSPTQAIIPREWGGCQVASLDAQPAL